MEFQIADMFEAVTDAVPANEALVCGRDGMALTRLTYAELEQRANRAANAFATLGWDRATTSASTSTTATSGSTPCSVCSSFGPFR